MKPDDRNSLIHLLLVGSFTIAFCVVFWVSLDPNACKTNFCITNTWIVRITFLGVLIGASILGCHIVGFLEDFKKIVVKHFRHGVEQN